MAPSARTFQCFLIHRPQHGVIGVVLYPRHEKPAPGIAAVAGRDEVLDPVVCLVAVQMVRNEVAFGASSAGLSRPFHFGLAPMAGVRTFANGVVEHAAMLVQVPVRTAEGMRLASGQCDVAVAGSRAALEFAPLKRSGALQSIPARIADAVRVTARIRAVRHDAHRLALLQSQAFGQPTSLGAHQPIFPTGNFVPKRLSTFVAVPFTPTFDRVVRVVFARVHTIATDDRAELLRSAVARSLKLIPAFGTRHNPALDFLPPQEAQSACQFSRSAQNLRLSPLCGMT